MFKTMWPLNKSSQQSNSGNGPRTKECLSNDLHLEVRAAAPGARLSYLLRNNLERLDKAERQELVSIVGKPDGCAPLFVACKKGNLEIVEYLIEVCGANVEQKGTYEVIDDKTSHYVTPLWCSAVCGRLNIVKCLVKHGANVNSVSDTGSTPVRSACFMTHFDIVQYLVEQAGADIQLPNFNGGTCLINSVQSSALCEYLLNRGANVNSQDIQLKTALHYAIQEHRFETTKLLLANGADPFLKNRYGDDSLQTSCLKGATLIFQYLIETVPGYSLERQAEMHELMGSTFLDEHHDIQMALLFWKKSIEMRYNSSGTEIVPKPELGYTPIYAQILDNLGQEVEVREFRTYAELETISTDLDQLRINSLLIAERVLGVTHKDLIFRIMYRGAAYADSSKYLLCIKLWRYALQLRIEKDSILYGDTCFTALALIRLYLDLDRSCSDPDYSSRELEVNPITVDDLMATFNLIIEQIPSASKLVHVRPVFKRQQESFDRCLRCCTHLLYLLLKTPNKTPQQFYQLRKATELLVQYNVKMCCNGDSLLHMAVSRNNVVRSHFFVDDNQVVVFPNLEVTKFLIHCGADVNAMNDLRATPLHHVTCSDNFNSEVVELLLKHGAHVDQLDNSNQSPVNILCVKPSFAFNPLQHIGLKCLAARAIGIHQIRYGVADLPKELDDFVECHRPKPRPDDSALCSKHKALKYSRT